MEWKDGVDLESLRTHAAGRRVRLAGPIACGGAPAHLPLPGRYAEFAEFVSQIAIVTATSHTRGSVGKTPGQVRALEAARE